MCQIECSATFNFQTWAPVYGCAVVFQRYLQRTGMRVLRDEISMTICAWKTCFILFNTLSRYPRGLSHFGFSWYPESARGLSHVSFFWYPGDSVPKRWDLVASQRPSSNDCYRYSDDLGNTVLLVCMHCCAERSNCCGIPVLYTAVVRMICTNLLQSISTGDHDALHIYRLRRWLQIWIHLHPYYNGS